MQVLGAFARVMGAAHKVGRCAMRFKWPILALLLVAPLVLTWSVEVFALNGLGMFTWFVIGRHILRLMGRR